LIFLIYFLILHIKIFKFSFYIYNQFFLINSFKNIFFKIGIIFFFSFLNIFINIDLTLYEEEEDEEEEDEEEEKKHIRKAFK
jgi:hypothetical protein